MLKTALIFLCVIVMVPLIIFFAVSVYEKVMTNWPEENNDTERTLDERTRVEERVFTVDNEISFSEIKEKDTTFIKIICPACSGDGKADFGSKKRRCDFCNGAGSKTMTKPKGNESICPKCRGFKRILLIHHKSEEPLGYKPCKTCSAKGIIYNK